MTQPPKYSEIDEPSIIEDNPPRHLITIEIVKLIKKYRTSIINHGTLQIQFFGYSPVNLENKLFCVGSLQKPVDKELLIVPPTHICPDIVWLLKNDNTIAIRFVITSGNIVYCQVRDKANNSWDNIETICTKNSYCIYI